MATLDKVRAPKAELTPIENPTPTNVSIQRTSEMDRMKAHFAAQKKVRVRIRPEDGEQWVQVNGYTFLIQPGEWVRVPEEIHEMLVAKGVA